MGSQKSLKMEKLRVNKWKKNLIKQAEACYYEKAYAIMKNSEVP